MQSPLVEKRKNGEQKGILQLVYLWIAKFRTFENTDLNFHSQFKFSFDKSTESLTFQYLEENSYINKYFPENQFISLIVGKNGVGKSSIFDLLFDGAGASGGDNLTGKIFAVFYSDENEEFKIWGAKFDAKEDRVISLTELHDKKKISILLPQPSMSEEELSLFYNKLNELTIVAVDFEFKGRGLYHTNNEITKNKYLISFYQKLNEAFKESIPRFLKISEISSESYLSEKIFESAIKWYKNNIWVNLFTVLPKVWHVFQKDKDKQFPEWFYIKYSLPSKKYYENLLDEKNQKMEKDYTNIKETILKIWDFISSNTQLKIFQKMKLNFLIFLIERYTKFSVLPLGINYIDILNKYVGDLTMDRIENFIKNCFQQFKEDILIDDATFFLREEVESFEKFLDYIENLQDKEQNDSKINEIEVKISDNNGLITDNISLLENIARIYRKLFNIGQCFILFDSHPPLSSGHWRLFEIFSDIEKALNPQFDNLKITDNILLLLDEPESYLHPEWQRCFIYFLTEFLKSTYNNKNFHIIINTHSPFLLSDIPKDNAMFLNLRNNKAEVSNLDNETLAQNIYYLLNDRSFMEIGIGEFVRNRIKEILDNEQRIYYYHQLINHIGDYVLQTKLLDIWKGLMEK